MMTQPSLVAASAVKRHEKAHMRRQIASGAVDLLELLADPPECLHGTHLHDLLKMAPGIGPYKLETLNHAAIRHRVNLMLRVERVGDRTRMFLELYLKPTPGHSHKQRYYGVAA